ncbi:MAG: 2-phosphosulfolactate phosphatase [Anaerolineales bacterium]|nr:2-phosphosulfolactate phosphatase [Anaerolineales bacterium]
MSMKFHHKDLETCHTASGLVIVIDVLRAFSHAAYAFSRGAKEIILVSTVEEALTLKSEISNSKAMGEVGGLPPAGFDFGNSPTQILEEDLTGLTLIQRTGAGTQGAVRCVNADAMLAASYVVADATVKYVLKIAPSEITFVITGGFNNDEDVSCAEYLERLFKGQKPDIKPFVRRVYDSKDAEQHLDPNQPEFPESDLDYCTQISRFNFSMPITRNKNRLTMQAIKP